MRADVILAGATLLLVAVTGWLVWVTLRGIQRQLWLQTFSEYTRRYAEIADMLSPEARRPGGSFDFAALSATDRDKVLSAMRRYLNLCSEEQFLRSRDMLDAKTWEIWKTGMRDTVRLTWFRVVWETLRPEYEYYGEFQAFMDELVGESVARRPITAGK